MPRSPGSPRSDSHRRPTRAIIVDGPDIEICFQKVALDRPAKTSVHLDIDSTNWHGEVDRLVALGATVKEWFDDHTWMIDPEGNDFCVVNAASR